MNPVPLLKLDTPRLILRPYAPGDGPLYFQVGQKNRAHLQRFESGNSILAARSADEAEKIINEICAAWREGRYFLMAAFDRTGAEFVGQVYVGVANRELPEYEVGYFVDSAHEGQGYISEAVRAVLTWIFQDLGAHRVSLRCSDLNLRSRRVAERCGFILEGHLRENRRDPDGVYSGDLFFGLLRQEFLEQYA